MRTTIWCQQTDACGSHTFRRALASPLQRRRSSFNPDTDPTTSRTAVKGVYPFANGSPYYYNLINDGDGVINSVKPSGRECERPATHDKGVECSGAPQGKGPTARRLLQSLSLITFASPKRPRPTRSPIIKGLRPVPFQELRRCFARTLPAARHYWSAGRYRDPHVAKELCVFESGRPRDFSALSRQPVGQGSDPDSAGAGAKHGFEFSIHRSPFTHPGCEQKSSMDGDPQTGRTMFLLGAGGSMNVRASRKPCRSIRAIMLGVWWSRRRAECNDAPDANPGPFYTALMLQHGAGNSP